MAMKQNPGRRGGFCGRGGFRSGWGGLFAKAVFGCKPNLANRKGEHKRDHNSRQHGDQEADPVLRHDRKDARQTADAD